MQFKPSKLTLKANFDTIFLLMPTTKTKRPARSGGGKKKSSAASITNYTTGLKWLYSHVDNERLRLVKYDDKAFSLNRMKQLLKLLGNPQDGLKCVHVAGTKGKGSTCAMIASMLQGCGYTVGSFSSPHLIDLRERIVINGDMIAYNECADIFREIAKVEDKLKGGPPTFFEIMTAAALKYFADQAVDIAVLETGLGGRLDCTTVVDPLVTALVRGAFEYQGQKCSAASRAYVPASLWKQIKGDLVDLTQAISQGDVTDFSNFTRSFSEWSEGMGSAYCAPDTVAQEAHAARRVVLRCVRCRRRRPKLAVLGALLL